MPAETPDERFDLEAIYDEEIAPLMTRILEVCKRHRMPMVASFNYSNREEEDAGFCTSYLGWPGREPKEFRRALRDIKNAPTIIAMTISSGPKGGGGT